jgi:hypothetical protein
MSDGGGWADVGRPGEEAGTDEGRPNLLPISAGSAEHVEPSTRWVPRCLERATRDAARRRWWMGSMAWPTCRYRPAVESSARGKSSSAATVALAHLSHNRHVAPPQSALVTQQFILTAAGSCACCKKAEERRELLTAKAADGWGFSTKSLVPSTLAPVSGAAAIPPDGFSPSRPRPCTCPCVRTPELQFATGLPFGTHMKLTTTEIPPLHRRLQARAATSSSLPAAGYA